MEQKEQKFVKGFYPKMKRAGAPDFVHSAGSFKIKDMIEFLQESAVPGEEFINFQILVSKKDNTKIYAVVDDWKPESKKTQEDVQASELKVDDEMDNMPNF